MTTSYGPSKHPERCAGKTVEVQTVRYWPEPRTFDFRIVDQKTGDEQLLRMTRFEALCLLEAMRRVLVSPGSSSWSPAAIGNENRGAPSVTAEDAPFPPVPPTS